MELDDQDMRSINDLATALEDIEREQNRVYVDEFNIYRELFLNSTQNNMERKEIQLLSTRFIKRFNPYRPIEVLGMDGTLMFKVPQLFVPMKTIDNKYLAAVDKFRSDGVSEIPRYSAEATQGLLSAIIHSQQDVTEEGFASYGEYIHSLQKAFKHDVETFEAIKNGDVVVHGDVTMDGEVFDDKKTNTDTTLTGMSWD